MQGRCPQSASKPVARRRGPVCGVVCAMQAVRRFSNRCQDKAQARLSRTQKRAFACRLAFVDSFARNSLLSMAQVGTRISTTQHRACALALSRSISPVESGEICCRGCHITFKADASDREQQNRRNQTQPTRYITSDIVLRQASKL